VVNALAQISFARGPRVQWPPGLPCALVSDGRPSPPNPGHNCACGNAKLCLPGLGLDGLPKLASNLAPIIQNGLGTEMTYCCGILVRDGLVMIADTRTNAGLDNVSTFRKLHIFTNPGDRIMAVASAGNLAISQSVLSTLTEGLEDPETGEIETLMNAPTMFQAAQRIGRAIRAVHATEGPALKSEDVSFDVSFLFGGQIKGARMRLFMVYTAGNFIECTTDTPYLQIGEHKYGKPVLDRAMHYDVELYEALKTGLISMDSTMRSNLGVGLPIDVLVVRNDVCDADLNHRIEAGEPYFHDLRSRWSAALRAAHQNIPRPPYKTESEAKS
jgi:putative proteasome-type protease